MRYLRMMQSQSRRIGRIRGRKYIRNASIKNTKIMCADFNEKNVREKMFAVSNDW